MTVLESLKDLKPGQDAGKLMNYFKPAYQQMFMDNLPVFSEILPAQQAQIQQGNMERHCPSTLTFIIPNQDFLDDKNSTFQWKQKILFNIPDKYYDDAKITQYLFILKNNLIYCQCVDDEGNNISTFNVQQLPLTSLGYIKTITIIKQNQSGKEQYVFEQRDVFRNTINNKFIKQSIIDTSDNGFSWATSEKIIIHSVRKDSNDGREVSFYIIPQIPFNYLSPLFDATPCFPLDLLNSPLQVQIQMNTELTDSKPLAKGEYNYQNNIVQFMDFKFNMITAKNEKLSISSRELFRVRPHIGTYQDYIVDKMYYQPTTQTQTFNIQQSFNSLDLLYITINAHNDVPGNTNYIRGFSSLSDENVKFVDYTYKYDPSKITFYNMQLEYNKQVQFISRTDNINELYGLIQHEGKLCNQETNIYFNKWNYFNYINHFVIKLDDFTYDEQSNGSASFTGVPVSQQQPLKVQWELRNYNISKPNGNGLTPDEVARIGKADYEIWQYYSRQFIIDADGNLVFVN